LEKVATFVAADRHIDSGSNIPRFAGSHYADSTEASTGKADLILPSKPFVVFVSIGLTGEEVR
jgi:hypothetical protein